tara:strand:- start:2322 stop:2759 length:438 start_codon:yes stop_codon:yes gene_type:complete
MKTNSYKRSDIEEKWHLINAEGKTLGRLAVSISNILTGKSKPVYSPNADLGDFVVVINAEKVRVTGKKSTQKVYNHHTGYPGGLKSKTFDKMLEDSPEIIIEKAVKGMLPKNKLSNLIIKKLKVYSGSEHPHKSQNPQTLEPQSD